MSDFLCMISEFSLSHEWLVWIPVICEFLSPYTKPGLTFIIIFFFSERGQMTQQCVPQC